MRLRWVSLAIASVVLAFPMVGMIAPRLVFRLYTNSLPIAPDHPHVQASLQSIQAIGSEAFCLLPMTALVPSFCINRSPSHASLPVLSRVGLEQHVFYQALVRNAPTPLMIGLVSSIGVAAEAEIVLDEALLFDDREIGVEGRADAMMLLNVSRVAGNTSTALHDLLVHIELSVARMLFLQDGILFSLSLLGYLEGGWYMCRGSSSLDRLIAISVDATTDSTRHIATVLQRTASLTSTLLATLREMHPDDYRIGFQCTGSATAQGLCSADAPQYLEGEDVLLYILARLTTLHAVLDGVSDLAYSKPRSPTAIHSTSTSISTAYLVMRSQQNLLETQLRTIQEARILAASGSKEKLGVLLSLLMSLF